MVVLVVSPVDLVAGLSEGCGGRVDPVLDFSPGTDAAAAMAASRPSFLEDGKIEISCNPGLNEGHDCSIRREARNVVGGEA